MKQTLTFFSLIFSFISFSQTALVNNQGADISILPGANMIIRTDSLHNYLGSIDNAGLLTIEGKIVNDATLNGGANAGIYKIQGDWVNNSLVNSGQDTVILYGKNQLITGSQPTVFTNLLLTGGVTAVKTQTIDAEVKGWLDLTNVELATAQNEMLVSNATNTSILKTAGENGFVSSLNMGKLTRATNATSVYNFPLGTPSSTGSPFYYRPIDMTPTSSFANTYSARLAKDPAIESYDPTILTDPLCKVNPLYYHQLYHNNGVDAAAIKMYFKSSDGAWSDVAQWNPANWQNTVTATKSNSNGFSTLEIPNWNNFSPHPFALASSKFKVNAGPDLEILEGATASIVSSNTANQVKSWEWQPNEFLQNNMVSNPKSTPTEDITYVLTVTDANGCEAKDSMNIKLSKELLLLPAGFSPNNDGHNDFFHCLNTNLSKLSISVWNRWGEKVFESDRTDASWDGYWRNELQPMGTYVWKAEYKIEGATKTRFAEGNITLVK